MTPHRTYCRDPLLHTQTSRIPRVFGQAALIGLYSSKDYNLYANAGGQSPSRLVLMWQFWTASMKKVYLETYGCQMNVSDSERVETALGRDVFEITADAENADVVLINTCSVREKAEQKLYTQVGRIRHADGPKPVVGVLG